MKKLFLFIAAMMTATVMNLNAATATNVKYIDADGKEQTCASATVVEDASSAVTWNAGWYVVTGTNVTLSVGAVCNGAVHLILADGAKLTATGSLEHAGITVSGDNNSLTIYGQTNQTGLLIATGGEAGAGIGGGSLKSGSDIIINGGTVIATGGELSAGIGGGFYGSGSNITINGGTVTATGDSESAGIGGGSLKSGSDITINGGTVTATGGSGASAIGNGFDCSTAASNIFVNPDLLLKADNNNPPTTEIAHASITDDVASLLAGKRYVTAGPDTLDYLHFVTLKDNATIQLNKELYVPLDIRMEYSFDRKVWKNYEWTGTQGDSILLPNTNDTVWLRAGGDTHLNATFNTNNNDAVFTFGANDSIAAGGNIMSLLDASCVQDTVPDHAFYRLFKFATQLVSAPKMPASKVGPFGYAFMYLNTRITEAPALPATTVSDQSYNGMFQDCSALVYGPAELPAATMFMACYYNMFSGCTNLLHAPEIKATMLAKNCFGWMFINCSKLEVDTCSGTCQGTPLNVPESYADHWNADMFYGCHKYIEDPLPGGHYYIKEWTGPRAITFQSMDSSKIYNSRPLVADSIMISDARFNRKWVNFDVTGSQTQVGESENTFTYVWNDADKAKDYAVDTIFGKLKVDYISTTPVTITIAALEKKYDGTPLEAEYSFTGVEATDSVALKLDTTTLTDAGIVAVKALDCKIMHGEMNVTNGYIVKPVQPGSLQIKPREITITSASDAKEYDMSPLTNDKITFTGDGFVQTDTVTVTVLGSQTKVGLSDNTFTYLLAGGAKEQNYTITTQYGTLLVYNPIHPVIEGMYDQWNIVLDVEQLTDNLETFINGVMLMPENVSWYIVKGEADQVNQVTGAVVDDELASPSTGFYHTEGKAMNNGYYCVVRVPEVENVMGMSYFQSNVVFIQTPAPTTPIRKAIQDGQLIIIKDGAMYNAQGAKL